MFIVKFKISKNNRVVIENSTIYVFNGKKIVAKFIDNEFEQIDFDTLVITENQIKFQVEEDIDYPYIPDCEVYRFM